MYYSSDQMASRDLPLSQTDGRMHGRTTIRLVYDIWREFHVLCTRVNSCRIFLLGEEGGMSNQEWKNWGEGVPALRVYNVMYVHAQCT